MNCRIENGCTTFRGELSSDSSLVLPLLGGGGWSARDGALSLSSTLIRNGYGLHLDEMENVHNCQSGTCHDSTEKDMVANVPRTLVGEGDLISWLFVGVRTDRYCRLRWR